MVRSASGPGAPRSPLDVDTSDVLFQQLASRIEGDPVMRTAIGEQAARAVEAALASLRRGTVPAFVTLDERLALRASVAPLLDPDVSLDDAMDLIDAEEPLGDVDPLVAGRLVPRWTERLSLWSADPGRPAAVRQVLRDVVGALMIEGDQVALEVLSQDAVWWRSAEEKARFGRLATAEPPVDALEDYIAWLRAAGYDARFAEATRSALSNTTAGV